MKQQQTTFFKQADMADTKKDNKPNIYRVQALERALDILDCFDFQNRELGLSQIARQTGLNMTTAKRLISNLTGRGYLIQDPRSRQYRLGMRLFELGSVVFSSFSLRKTVGPYMSRLEKETGHAILLGINMDDQLVYIDKRKGSGMIRVSSEIGWRRPLHHGMLGMLLLAFTAPEKTKAILNNTPLIPHTPHSITDPGAFSLRLETIRQNGYCVEKEEAVEGIIGIAAPIRDFSRQVVAALGVTLPVSQDSEKEIKKTVKLLLKATREISSDLGYLKI